MREIRLDGREMKTKKATHDYLKQQLNLPSYYGNNLDALYDVLGDVDKYTAITLFHKDACIASLGRYGEKLLQVFEDAAEDNSMIIYKTKEDAT
jgi:ribonuclease inhibitor